MDTAGATQSCASNTLGTRCFGLHDGPANLVDVWRIDHCLNLVRVAHVCDLSMCGTIHLTYGCTAHAQRPKTTQSKRDLTNFHASPLWKMPQEKRKTKFSSSMSKTTKLSAANWRALSTCPLILALPPLKAAHGLVVCEDLLPLPPPDALLDTRLSRRRHCQERSS